jgi:hypothetical protein
VGVTKQAVELERRPNEKHGMALLYAAEELEHDKEIMATAVAQSGGGALQCAANAANEVDELKADKEIVATAVAQDGNALQYAAAELKADKEIVATAVAQYGIALEYAPPRGESDTHTGRQSASTKPSPCPSPAPRLAQMTEGLCTTTSPGAPGTFELAGSPCHQAAGGPQPPQLQVADFAISNEDKLRLLIVGPKMQEIASKLKNVDLHNTSSHVILPNLYEATPRPGQRAPSVPHANVHRTYYPDTSV